jgi:hypothetical protein
MVAMDRSKVSLRWTPGETVGFYDFVTRCDVCHSCKALRDMVLRALCDSVTRFRKIRTSIFPYVNSGLMPGPSGKNIFLQSTEASWSADPLARLYIGGRVSFLRLGGASMNGSRRDRWRIARGECVFEVFLQLFLDLVSVGRAVSCWHGPLGCICIATLPSLISATITALPLASSIASATTSCSR